MGQNISDFGGDVFEQTSNINKCNLNNNIMTTKEERQNGWLDLSLYDIIQEYKDGDVDEPLDGDEVDNLCELIKSRINLQEGNITEQEYLAS